MPDTLILEQFRTFGVRAELPLRPITLVYGANNSGKSALLRALALLGAAVEPGQGQELRIPDEVYPDMPPLELVWKGEPGLVRWTLGLRWGEEAADFGVDVDSSQPPSVGRVTVRGLDGDGVYERSGVGGQRRLREEASGQLLELDGLIPGPQHPGLAARLHALRGQIRWLSSVRARPPRVTPSARSREEQRLGDGADVLGLLLRQPALLEQVNAFYGRLVPGKALLVNQAGRAGTWLDVVSAREESFRVHLNDSGEGLTQVLPVLVKAALTAEQGGLLAVEEPESHLHMDAQRQLAEHLCTLAARAQGAARFVLETHSRIFLAGVQLAVAQGTLTADQVRVVWVDQEDSGLGRTTTVALNPDGSLGDGWPRAALAQDLRLGMELARAMAARGPRG